MSKYTVQIVPEAKEQLNRYLSYILFVFKNEQAADAVLDDYFKTVDILSEVAGTIREPDEPELRERGLKKIFFQNHDYVILFEIDGNEAVIVYIFHTTEDYANKL